MREPTNHDQRRHSPDRRSPAAPAGIARPELQSGASRALSEGPGGHPRRIGRLACKSGRGSTVGPPVTPAHTLRRHVVTHSKSATPSFQSAEGSIRLDALLPLPQQTRLRLRPTGYFPKRSLCVWISRGKANKSRRTTQRKSCPPRLLLCQPARRRTLDVRTGCVPTRYRVVNLLG